MPLPKRVPHEHTEAGEQIKQLCLWPEQCRYELLRPQLNIQRRLADFNFAQVTNWEGAKLEHERGMASHNEQVHWAHRQREDGKWTPAEVLDHAVGHTWAPEYLHRVFFTRRFGRWLDRLGSLRFRQWHLYGEEGLARQAATVWLYGKTLTVEFANIPLTQFTVAFQPDQKRLRTVKLFHRFETYYRSPSSPCGGRRTSHGSWFGKHRTCCGARSRDRLLPR